MDKLLSPFSGLCTHELLHEARKYRYGAGYDRLPPGDSHAKTGENAEGGQKSTNYADSPQSSARDSDVSATEARCLEEIDKAVADRIELNTEIDGGTVSDGRVFSETSFRRLGWGPSHWENLGTFLRRLGSGPSDPQNANLTEHGVESTPPDLRQEQEMSEHLLSLSRAGHVPITPHTREFEGYIRGFVGFLLDSYWRGTKPLGYESPTWPPPYYHGHRIVPIGSFPCDTKVGDIDEFDYMCVLQLNNASIHTEFDKYGQWKGTIPEVGQIPWEFHAHCQKVLNHRINRGTSSADPAHQVVVMDISQHGPATCIELSWRCNHGDTHDVSIDVSLAVTSAQPYISVFIMKNVSGIAGLGQHLRQVIRGEQMFVMDKSSLMLSSCIYDTPLFDGLERHASNNLRSVFRALKLLTKYYLPHRIIASNENSSGWCVKPGKSSHQLKCLVFEEVRRHPDPRDWEGERLVDRAVGALEMLGHVEYTDIITGFDVGSDSTDKRDMMPIVMPLVPHLLSKYNYTISQVYADIVPLSLQQAIEHDGLERHREELLRLITDPGILVSIGEEMAALTGQNWWGTVFSGLSRVRPETQRELGEEMMNMMPTDDREGLHFAYKISESTRYDVCNMWSESMNSLGIAQQVSNMFDELIAMKPTVDPIVLMLRGESPLLDYDVTQRHNDVTQGLAVVYIEVKNQTLHKVLYHRDTALPIADVGNFLELRAYIPPQGAPAPYLSHPLIQWCGQYVAGRYQRKPGVDLTRLPEEELQPGWYGGHSRYHYIWGLMYGGILSQEDLDSGRYRAELDALRGLMATGDRESPISTWSEYLCGVTVSESPGIEIHEPPSPPTQDPPFARDYVTPSLD